MTPEERSLLENVVRLSEENNQMLRAIRRGALVDRTLKLVYWGILIVLSIVGYFGFQVYLKTLTDPGASGGILQTSSNAQEMVKQLQGLIQ